MVISLRFIVCGSNSVNRSQVLPPIVQRQKRKEDSRQNEAISERGDKEKREKKRESKAKEERSYEICTGVGVSLQKWVRLRGRGSL